MREAIIRRMRFSAVAIAALAVLGVLGADPIAAVGKVQVKMGQPVLFHPGNDGRRPGSDDPRSDRPDSYPAGAYKDQCVTVLKPCPCPFRNRFRDG